MISIWLKLGRHREQLARVTQARSEQVAIAKTETMKYTTITYHRKKNLGNYETEDITLTAELDEDDDCQSAIEVLKHDAKEALGIDQPKHEVNLEEIAF